MTLFFLVLTSGNISMFYAKTRVECDSLGLSGFRQKSATNLPSPLKQG
jgi:hypothetical protein